MRFLRRVRHEKESNNGKLNYSYENKYGNIWNDFESEVYRDGDERDLMTLIDKVKKLI